MCDEQELITISEEKIITQHDVENKELKEENEKLGKENEKREMTNENKQLKKITLLKMLTLKK